MCTRIYDALGTIFQDADLVSIFLPQGQPAEALVRLALATILQFAEGLSDRAAANAVRSRIDWKYLLCLELTDSGFDHTVLSEFRTRLLKAGAEQFLFDTLLSKLREKGLLKARGRQRTGSTHVLAAVRAMNRLECVVETMRHALNCLAVVAPEWLREHSPAEWVDRYGPRADDYRLPTTKAEREAYAEVDQRQSLLPFKVHKKFLTTYSRDLSNYIKRLKLIEPFAFIHRHLDDPAQIEITKMAQQ